mmetsp:Transcript_14574/g.36079  ORF Transcript_14574/g.36079 Transcript_14574/m.36079 type:complete len:223 (-) Transcript_14574:95-763(-)
MSQSVHGGVGKARVGGSTADGRGSGGVCDGNVGATGGGGGDGDAMGIKVELLHHSGSASSRCSGGGTGERTDGSAAGKHGKRWVHGAKSLCQKLPAPMGIGASSVDTRSARVPDTMPHTTPVSLSIRYIRLHSSMASAPKRVLANSGASSVDVYATVSPLVVDAYTAMPPTGCKNSVPHASKAMSTPAMPGGSFGTRRFSQGTSRKASYTSSLQRNIPEWPV